MRPTKEIVILNFILLFIGIPSALRAQSDGALPIPVFTDVTIDATVSHDAPTDRYTYGYSISNPATNTGKIYGISIDVSAPQSITYSDLDFNIPFGISTKPFSAMLAYLQGLKGLVPVIPFGQSVPDGWSGGLGARGIAMFDASNSGSSTGQADYVYPGETQQGFALISHGVPTIREVVFEPDWIYVSTSTEGIADEETRRAHEINQAIRYTTETLGPAAVRLGSFDHWDQLRNDIEKAKQKGWISDAALADTLMTQLASARAALDAEDGTLAKSRLQALLATIKQSTPSQRRQEVFDLVRLNVESLIAHTEDTPTSYEPALTITPEHAEVSLGSTHTIAMALTNSAAAGTPAPYHPLAVDVVTGPDQGQHIAGPRTRTDESGNLLVTYSGAAEGTDTIDIIDLGEPEIPLLLGVAEVTWRGGADLAVPFFIPPLIKSAGGNSVFVSDVTTNIGTLPSVPSTTRYYLSGTDPPDPATASVIGERPVGNLEPHELNQNGTMEFPIPDGLPPGTYYLAACADADNTVAERDEQNNCSFSQVSGMASIVVPAEQPGSVQTIFDLSARAKSGKVDIVWSPVEGSDSYDIYRSTSQGGPYELIAAGHITDYCAYADFGLTNGVTYYYVVRSILNGLQSLDSNQASATPMARPSQIGHLTIR